MVWLGPAPEGLCCCVTRCVGLWGRLWAWRSYRTLILPFYPQTAVRDMVREDVT